MSLHYYIFTDQCTSLYKKRFCYHSSSVPHSLSELSYSMHREMVSMATSKGHLQEVLSERAQNAIWIFWLPVMTDNIPHLIRETDCDEVGGDWKGY